MGAVLKCLTSEQFGEFTDVSGDKFRISRDEIFVTTKNGYVPDDADNGVSVGALVEDLVD